MKTVQPDIKIALGSDFLLAFSRLPQSQQKKVRTFLDKFTSSPDAASLNVEKIQAAPDPNVRSVRIDQQYRGILLKPHQGNIYVLLWVDKHDEAYQWAARRTCRIHPETGTIQVMLTDEAADQALAESSEPSPSPESDSQNQTPALFAAIPDAVLIGLGVPCQLLKHVRAIQDEADLNSLETILPHDAFEAVFMLAAGYAEDQVRSELGIAREAAVDTDDFDAAVQRDGSKRQFVVITDAAEMEAILAAPLEQWRVFLHPSQRRLVQMKAGGPVRVLGSAGTGKTVVAMHRAAWLVRHVCNPVEKVLFTTFTRNLAADIADNLKKLCSHDEWAHIEVVNLDAWAWRFLEKHRFTQKIAYEDPLRDDLWQKALNMLPAEAPLSPAFLKAEWINVIQANGIEDEKAYLTVSRVGRSQRLSRRERVLIWPVFAEYRALMNEKGLWEPADAFRAAANVIEHRKVKLPYRAVVVDEAQDFGNEAFRLIRSIGPCGDNDLFIVGDAHQRLYGHHVVLSRCGINIRGRGRKLRINYRTTEEVKNWATALLKGLPFDDLDAGTDDIHGVRSLTHGPAPMIEPCDGEAAASAIICNHIKQLVESNQTSPGAICLVARSHHELDTYQHYIENAGMAVHRIETGKAENRSAAGVRLATIHRVKGLEFDHVIFAGRLDDIESSVEPNEIVIQNRTLLYVAATRPRNSLLVCRLKAPESCVNMKPSP